MFNKSNCALTCLLVLTIGSDMTISDNDFLATITTNSGLRKSSGSTSPTYISMPSPSPMSLTKISNRTSGGDSNIIVQAGTHAYLPCNVQKLHGKPVSWVRVRDGHILTVDQTTFIADQRFQSIYAEDQDRWSLQIKYVQPHDMGLYECQVSTEPKMSAQVHLKVVVPRTELIGDHNRFVKAGSKVALHCIVRGSIEPPTYIIWFKGNDQITESNNRGWYIEIDNEIFGNSSDRQNTIGSLIIPSVSKSDTGNYTCSPSNSAPVTVDLHVLNGEYSASAIMSSATANYLNCLYLLLSLLAVLKHRT